MVLHDDNDFSDEVVGVAEDAGEADELAGEDVVLAGLGEHGGGVDVAAAAEGGELGGAGFVSGGSGPSGGGETHVGGGVEGVGGEEVADSRIASTVTKQAVFAAWRQHVLMGQI